MSRQLQRCQFIWMLRVQEFNYLHIWKFQHRQSSTKISCTCQMGNFDKVAQPLPFPCLFPPNILCIMSLWFWQSTHARHCHPRHFPPESSLSNPLFLASSKSFHLEGKRTFPVGDVHCCETAWATCATHTKKSANNTGTTHMLTASDLHF